MKFRPDIEGLRALAVIPVVCFHAGLGFPGGYVGVDVFFVISGFLITSIILREIQERDFSIIRFYERRIRRILPALLVVMVLTTLAACALLIPRHLIEYGKSLGATAVFFSNFYFYGTEGYFTETAELKPLLHTWSLAIEEQYYIFFPPLLYVLCKYMSLRRVAGFLILLGAGSLLFSGFQIGSNPQAAFYLPAARMWELLAGSILALAMAGGLRPGSAIVVQTLGLAGLIAILIPVFAYDQETPFPGWAAVPPCLGAAVILFAGANGTGLAARLLSLAPFRFVGRISYSLYLWHWPLISFTYYVSVAPLTLAQGVVCVFSAAVLATLSYWFVERPFRVGGLLDRRGLFAVSAGAMAASIGIGFVLVHLDGLPSRFERRFEAIWNGQDLDHDRRDCHFVTPERAAADDVCLRGAEGIGASFVLVGDSHADAISPGVFDAARSLSLAGYHYTNAGFRPLPGVTRASPAGSVSGEIEPGPEDQAFFVFLDRHREVATVVYTGFWVHQATGSSYRHRPTLWIDAEYDGSELAYNRTSFENGLRRLVRRFPDRNFILLDDVPSGNALDLRTYQRQALYNREQLEVSFGGGIARADADRQRSQYEDILQRLAATEPNVRYVRVFDVLCDDKHCPLFDDRRPRYRNGDHLSARMALELSETLRTRVFGNP